jgi:hypothetical protein
VQAGLASFLSRRPCGAPAAFDGWQRLRGARDDGKACFNILN